MPRRHPPAPLALEPLDDRLVPTVVDLTHPGAHAVVGGAIVQQTPHLPTKTNDIDPFVQIHGSGVEQGYNTDARPLQFRDENPDRHVTHALTAGQVPRVNINGTDYREFLLDINQDGARPDVVVDQIQLYFGDSPKLTGYNPHTKTLAGKAPAYDLDAAGDVSILLNDRLNRGRGTGDMFLYVPDSVFVGTTTGTYVYLYSKMGGLHGAAADCGSETTWSVRDTGVVTQPPAPPVTTGTGSLSGAVYGQDLSGNYTGMSGLKIQLTGKTAQGQTVSLTTTTDDTGAFTFTGLLPGTYSILLATPPAGYQAGPTQVGTVNGTTDGAVNAANASQIDQITLGDNQAGVNYNFFEVQPTG